MRKSVLLGLLFVTILISTGVCAQTQKTAYKTHSGNFGLGVILGEPTGISGKLWLGNGMAIDGAVAWSLSKNYSLHIHGDYLFHNFTLIDVEQGKLPLYYGIGGRIKIREDDPNDNNDDDAIGVRFPVGLAYLFEGAPVDIFVEVVPILDLAPDTDFDINGAIGFRYFF